ncbi:aldehyde dehydrogenase family protein [Aliifodinibius sp. S!AR15-10]|uniref:aldehyde dehydrogenase family protein n=1 Tax=Aliifodinibius sp. S!AR15-10 TaxID=2950437 RepID=UPI00285A2E44|nr:aldehyde dehydrogenase family protein [Aliifodinibius sp. S!AR15-10]MDR8392380.1 aldehyde dehydrogenase family protein [Aliifodinibius sp. S!AR15-10]
MTDRIEVKKTYKTYIGGNFPRTESGRSYKVYDEDENFFANACRCSRKDVRDAVLAAREAFDGWKSRTAYNRGQILYRIAEMLEGRKAQFVEELTVFGSSEKEARNEVYAAIDRLIYYAGWSDKFQQVYSTVNPVASNHFNFSIPDPMGVVSVLAPQNSALLGLVSVIAPIIVGGNTCVVLAARNSPNVAISFAEVLHSSDVPGGIVNLLTGFREELIPHLSSHMDVNAFFYTEELDQETRKQIDENAALNVKRVVKELQDSWDTPEAQNPELIMNFQEIKTTWHPIGN